MVEYAKSHRRPIPLEIGGQVNQFYVVGYLARALRRSVWTVGFWERVKLLPEPSAVWYQGDPYTRRRLYIADYVDALEEIASQTYGNGRLLREDWQDFQAATWSAFNEHVVPITGGVLFDATDQIPMDRSGQGSPRHDLSAH